MNSTGKGILLRWYAAGVCWAIVAGIAWEMILVLMGRSDPETTAIRAVIATGVGAGLLALVMAPLGIWLWYALSRRVPSLETGVVPRLLGLSLLTICLNVVPFTIFLIVLQDASQRTMQGYFSELSFQVGGLWTTTWMLGVALLLPRLSVKGLRGALFLS